MRETDGQRDSEDREETRGRREESGTRGKSVSCAWPALLRGAHVAKLRWEGARQPVMT